MPGIELLELAGQVRELRSGSQIVEAQLVINLGMVNLKKEQT